MITRSGGPGGEALGHFDLGHPAEQPASEGERAADDGIAKKLHQHGFEQVVGPESFLVDKQNHLEPGEEAHAHRWAEELAEAMSRMQPQSPR